MRCLTVLYEGVGEHVSTAKCEIRDIEEYNIFVHTCVGLTKGHLFTHSLGYCCEYDVVEADASGDIRVYLEKGRADTLLRVAAECRGQFLPRTRVMLLPSPCVRVESFPRDIVAVMYLREIGSETCADIIEHLFTVYIFAAQSLTKCLALTLCGKALDISLEEMLKPVEQKKDVYLNIL